MKRARLRWSFAAIFGMTFWFVPGIGGALTSEPSISAAESIVLYDDGHVSAGYEVYDADDIELLASNGPDAQAATVTLLGGLEADIPHVEPTALSAHTCEGRVCINVKGSGNSVSSMKITAVQYSYDGCQAPDAYFYAKHPANDYYYHFDSWFNTYPCVTASPNAVVRWWAKTDEVPAKFMDGTRLGGQWAPNPPFTGFPTVRIRDHYVNLGPIKI